MYKKILVFIIILVASLSIFLKFISHNEKDFIYVVPKIKYIEVLDRNIGEYSILSPDGEKMNFEMRNFLNGKIFFNVPNGEYILEINYDNQEKYVSFIKDDNWKKIIITLQGDTFSKKQEIALNLITLTLIILNVFIYIKTNKEIKKDKILNSAFFILILKILFSFRGNFQTDFIKFLEFFISAALGFLIIFYILNNRMNKKYKKIKYLVYVLTALSFVYYTLIAINLLSPQIYTYILSTHEILLTFLRKMYQFINLRRIILLVIMLNLLINKRFTISPYKFYYFSVIFLYLFMEFFYIAFPKFINLYSFIKLIEYMCIYWGLVFVSLKIYTPNISRVVRYLLGFTIAYITLFYFKTLLEPGIILITIFILDFYTMTFEKILFVKTEILEKSYTKLCLVQNRSEFEEELEKELKKNLKVKSVLVKIFIDEKEILEYLTSLDLCENNLFIKKENIRKENYSTGIRLAFNGNPYVGAIFIEEYEYEMDIENIKYLIGISEKVAGIANNIKLNSIYKELSFDD